MDGKREFEQELGEYIDDRKKSKIDLSGIANIFKKKHKESPKLSPEVETYGEAPVNKQEEAPKKTGLTKIMEAVGLVEKQGMSPEEEEQKIKELVVKEETLQDLKEVSKIALKAIKQLPQETLAEFKQSPDFQTLKEILKKRNLIK